MTAVPPEGAVPSDGALADDGAAFERPLFEAFAEIVARQPNHLAVDDGNDRLSYAELRDRALALGAWICATVPADGLVGVLVPPNTLCPVAWLACFATRRAFLPLDPYLPPARSHAIIAEAGIAAVLVPTMTADLAAWLPTNLPRIPMVGELGAAELGAAERGAGEPGAGELAPEQAPLPLGVPPAAVGPAAVGPAAVGMVLFTSGSTGRPKGIALHERAALRRAMHDRTTCDLGPHDRLLSLHPPVTSAGLRDVLDALLSGASLHLVDLKRDGLAHVLARLRAGGITICAGVPVVVRALMAMEGADGAFRGLRIMRLSGDVVMGSDIAGLARLLAPTARILLTFGMTEAGVLLERMIDPFGAVETGRVASGTPVPGQMLSVEDATGHPVKPGETGTLVIRGRYLALGHWVAGKLDPTAFPPDPSAPGYHRYRTSDMFMQRADGMFVPIGRADRQVKINGIRVEPGDTEATLRGLPGVADAAVLVHDAAGVPVLVAFVVPAQGDQPAANATRFARSLRPRLAALLPPPQVPTHIHAVPAIPLLPSMKPDLAALRALLLGKKASGVIARVWTALRRAASLSASAPLLPPVRRDDAPS